jgi:hypothetical protein
MKNLLERKELFFDQDHHNIQKKNLRNHDLKIAGGKIILGQSEWSGEHNKKKNTRYYINLPYYMKKRAMKVKNKEIKITSKRGLCNISHNTNQERELVLASIINSLCEWIILQSLIKLT